MQDLATILAQPARALTRADAAAVRNMPPSAALVAAMEANRGGLVRVERPDPHSPRGFPLVSYAPRPAPLIAGPLLTEAEQRLQAVRALLAPASLTLRRQWVAAFASAVRNAPKGEGLDDAIATLAGLLDLPPVCFRAQVEPEPGEAPEQTRFRGMIERVRSVARACDGWWSSWADIEPILSPHAAPLRAEEKALSALVERAREEADSPAPLRLAAPSNAGPTADDVRAYLAELDAKHPADRRRCARAFRDRLRLSAPELAREFAPELGWRAEAQASEPEAPPVTPVAARLREVEERNAAVPKLRPGGTMARMMAEQAARRTSQAHETKMRSPETTAD